MASREIRDYLARIGSKGEKKSRRHLNREDARNMVRVRKARRAFARDYGQCFWYLRKDMQVTLGDIPAIVSAIDSTTLMPQSTRCWRWRAGTRRTTMSTCCTWMRATCRWERWRGQPAERTRVTPPTSFSTRQPATRPTRKMIWTACPW